MFFGLHRFLWPAALILRLLHSTWKNTYIFTKHLFCSDVQLLGHSAVSEKQRVIFTGLIPCFWKVKTLFEMVTPCPRYPSKTLIFKGTCTPLAAAEPGCDYSSRTGFQQIPSGQADNYVGFLVRPAQTPPPSPPISFWSILNPRSKYSRVWSTVTSW